MEVPLLFSYKRDMPMITNSVIVNADMALVRNEVLEGRNYKAIPMVMLKEAVLNGSNGPTFYPADEIRKAPIGWNYKPVVVYHPTVNGQGVSATDPVIIEQQKIGLIMNTKFVDGVLKAEAWIDVDKANKVDERVMTAINNGQMVEVSTGLFSDTEVMFGTHDGDQYGQIARNYVPDHLAVLPDKKGALSIEAGAGLLRNEDEEQAAEESDSTVEPQDVSPFEEPVMANQELVDSFSQLLQLNSEDTASVSSLTEGALNKAIAALPADAPAVIHNSVEDALAAMAPEVAVVFKHGLEAYQAEKAELVAKITANSDQFDGDFLSEQGIKSLKAIASLIKTDEAPAEEVPAEEAPADETPEVPAEEAPEAPAEPTNNEEAPVAKFVGLSGINASAALALNSESDDFDMIPKGIDFSK